MMKLKDILKENVLDQAADGLFNKIQPSIKSLKGVRKELFVLDHGSEQGAFNLKLIYAKRPNLDHVYDITASGMGGDIDDPGELNITVQYRPTEIQGELNGLEAEMHEVIRHEMEHIGQQSFDDMFVVAHEPNEDYDTYENYLIQADETPAYVQGLVTRAVHKKITFDQALEEWHTENIANFQTSGKEGRQKADWSRIKKVWVDWAKANKDKLKKHD